MLNNSLSNPDLLSLDLQFAADKTLTARRGPTPILTRTQASSTGSSFVGSNGLIQYAAADTARFDHDPVSLVCKGLLIEEQRANLVQQSSNFLNGYWATGSSVSSATSSNPDGTTSAFLVTGNGASYVTTYNATNITVTASTVYTLSVYVKAGTVVANTLVMAAYDATASGFISGATALTPTFTDAGNGWYRATASVTTPVGCTLLRAYMCRTNNFTGTFYIWGAQVEAGAFATSYIPTTTSSLTRSADVCSITGSAFTGIYNQPEGTFLSSASQPVITSGNALVYAADNGSTTERFNLRHQTSISLSQVSGSTQSTFGGMGSPTANSISKMAYAYKASNYAAARNSTLGSSGSNGTVPTVDRIYIGAQGFNSIEYLNGHIQFLRLYKKRLPDAKLQTLTT